MPSPSLSLKLASFFLGEKKLSILDKNPLDLEDVPLLPLSLLSKEAGALRTSIPIELRVYNIGLAIPPRTLNPNLATAGSLNKDPIVSLAN